MMQQFAHQLRSLLRDADRWLVYASILSLLIGLPFLAIGLGALEGVGEMWQHVLRHLLPGYLLNSLLLIVGTSLLTLFIGVSSAWVVSSYEFRFRQTAELLLFLPLAIPSYIMAYAYTGIFDNGGTWIALGKSLGLNLPKIDLMNPLGLIWVLGLSLFPYVYVSARVAFQNLSSSLQESAYLLGASHRSYFRTIALPLASPAVIGGLFLVIMEVLNDYGAAKYYGVQTFTTGIFRTWNFLNDLQSAIYLAVILVALVFVLGWLERLRRGRRSYALTGRREQGREQRRALPKGGKRLLCLFVILLPILAGLVLPLAQLTYWALMTIGDQWSKALLWTSLQSFGLASTVAVLALICSFCLIYYSRWSRSRLTRVYPRLVSIGYVMPGAIIGIGIIGALQWLVDFFASGLDWKIGAYVYNSLFILLYAYLFRFLAVAYGPIEAENIRIGRQLAESSSLLGKKPLSTLFNIDIPLLTQSALSAFALVFIDAMKELPLTLLLKPYDVQTLSMTAYQYADDELVQQAGLPALLLISVVGLLLALLKNRLLSRE